MMNKIRDWSFPAAVLLAWALTGSYTVNALSAMPRPPATAAVSQLS